MEGKRYIAILANVNSNVHRTIRVTAGLHNPWDIVFKIIDPMKWRAVKLIEAEGDSHAIVH